MALYPPGTLIFVNYGERPQCIHSRLVLSHVHEDDYIVLTPDGDLYSETMSPQNPDFTGFFPSLPGGGIPAGVRAANVYSFAPMSAAEYAGHMEAADAERLVLGVAAAAPAVPAVAPAVAPAIAPVAAAASPVAVSEVWVLAEFIEGKKIDDVMVPPAGCPTLDKWGLMKLTDSNGLERPCLIHQLPESDIPSFCEERIRLARISEASAGSDLSAADDVRTLEVRYGLNGERLRSFRESVNELQEVEFSDYPLEPRTALSYVKAIASIAESATAQHHMWINSSRIPEGDRSVYEDEVLARILDTAVTYDALNVANLASMELVCRRRQLLAEAHSQNPAAPSYMGAEHFLGQTYKAGGGIVTPVLAEHVAKRLQQQSQIWKEKRKAEENRKFPKKLGPPSAKVPQGGKGGGGATA